MLRRDRRWIELAFSLQFTMPGTPVLRYGDEIGIGENLDLPSRAALRTPMQWSDEAHAGFAPAGAASLVVPVEKTGPGGFRRTNVRAQQRDPSSLLRWFEQLISTLRECPEIGVGTCSVLDVGDAPSVLVHRFDAPEGSILLLHNLSDRPATVTVGPRDGIDQRPWEVFADADYPRPAKTLRALPINGHGYRWIRLRKSAAD
jgi:maltose alpha-D-glucosyltransferase/alpha-amylase